MPSSTTAGSFVYPPPFGAVGDYSDDVNVALDSTVKIQWTGAPTPTATLWLFKDLDGYTCVEFNLAKTYCAQILPAFQNENSYNWAVQTYNMTYNSASPWYYLVIRGNTGSTGASFNSHYFNILPANQVVSSSTSSTSSSASSTRTTSSSSSTKTSLTTSATSTISATTSSTSSTSSSTAIPLSQSSTGLTTGSKAAIGVAVGVGIPLIAILLYIAILLSRRKSKSQKSETSYSGPNQPSTLPEYYAGTGKDQRNPTFHANQGYTSPPVSELYTPYSPRPQVVSELPSEVYRS